MYGDEPKKTRTAAAHRNHDLDSFLGSYHLPSTTNLQLITAEQVH